MLYFCTLYGTFKRIAIKKGYIKEDDIVMGITGGDKSMLNMPIFHLKK